MAYISRFIYVVPSFAKTEARQSHDTHSVSARLVCMRVCLCLPSDLIEVVVWYPLSPYPPPPTGPSLSLSLASQRSLEPTFCLGGLRATPFRRDKTRDLANGYSLLLRHDPPPLTSPGSGRNKTTHPTPTHTHTVVHDAYLP